MADEYPDGIDECDLHAFLDGALDPAREVMVRNYLVANPQVHDRLARYAEQNLALAAAGAEPAWPSVPQPLAHRLYGDLNRRRWLHRSARVAASFLLIAAGWVANDVLQRPAVAAIPYYAQEAADAHELFANDPARPVEIPASKPEEIRRWLTAKLGEQVPLPELERIGLRLVGARVLGTDQGATAQLTYEDGQGRRMTLSLATNEDLAPINPTLSQFDGLEVACWRSDDFALAAIATDLPLELNHLAEAVDLALLVGQPK